MKFRTTLILFLLVIGLGAFLIFFSLRQPSARDYKERDKRVLPASEFQKGGEARKGLSDLATRLTLRNGKDSILLERDAKSALDWRIAAPVAYPADSGIVSSILSEIEFLTAARVIDPAKQPGLDLAAYGLAAPEQSVTIGVGDRAFKLDLGGVTTDGKSAYVATERKLIYVVPKTILAKAATRLNDLRDKTALRFDKSALTRLSAIAAGAPTVELAKEKTLWKMLQPVADDTDAASVTKLLDSLAALRIGAEDFITDSATAPAEYGLAPPALTVALFEGDARRALLVGAPAKDRPGKRYAMREKDTSVFALDQKDIDALPKAPADLRCRVALAFDIADATRIEIAGPARVLLTRSGEEWKMEEPAGQTASADAVRLFLARLAALEIKEYLDAVTPERLRETGLDQPRATVALTTKDGGLRKLLFGVEKSGKFLSVRRGDTGPILTVPADIFADLAAGYVLFLSRRVLDLPRDQITALTLTQREKRTALVRKDKKWSFAPPAAGEPNAQIVDQLLWTVAYLEALRVVSDKPDPALHGFDAPRLKLAVTHSAADGKTETKTLLLGKEAPEGLLAMVEGGRYVYAVSKDLLRQLSIDLAPAPPGAPANP
jgi:hypothetical protein